MERSEAASAVKEGGKFGGCSLESGNVHLRKQVSSGNEIRSRSSGSAEHDRADLILFFKGCQGFLSILRGLFQFLKYNFRVVLLLEIKLPFGGKERHHLAVPVLQPHPFPSVPDQAADRLGIAADPSGGGVGKALDRRLDPVF